MRPVTTVDRTHTNTSDGTSYDSIILEMYHDVKQISRRQEGFQNTLDELTALMRQNLEESVVLQSTLKEKAEQERAASKETPPGGRHAALSPADERPGPPPIRSTLREMAGHNPLFPDDLGGSSGVHGDGRGRRAVRAEDRYGDERASRQLSMYRPRPSVMSLFAATWNADPATGAAAGVPDGWPGTVRIRKGLERATETERTPTSGQRLSRGSSSENVVRLNATSSRADDLDDASNYRYMMDPNSQAAVLAGWMGLLLVMYDMIATPYVLAYQVADNPGLSVMFLISASWWSLTIVLTCRTGVYSHGELRMEPLIVARQYLRTWFIFDTALVTTDWVSVFSTSATDPGILRIARSVRIVKMLRMAKVFSVLETIANHRFPRARRFMIILEVAIGTFLFVHVASCAWYAIGVFLVSDTGTHWPTKCLRGDESSVYVYFIVVHWVWSQMTLAGSTDVNATTSSERMFTVVLMTCGVIFSSLIMSIVSTEALEYVATRREQLDTIAKLRTFMQQHSIPAKLAGKVQKQVVRRIKDQTALLTEHNVAALDLLSNSLRGALLRETRTPHLTRHTLFRLWAQMDPLALRALCDKAVRLAAHAHQDLVFVPGHLAQEALYVIKGSLRYTQDPDSSLVDDTCVTEVRPGSWLCEAALWSHWVHVGTLETVASSLLLGISASGLLSVVNRFTKIQELTRSYGRAFHSRIATSVPPFTPWPNDLLVPCTNASGLLGSSVGLALVQRRFDAGTLSIPEDEYLQLQQQIEDEVCAVLESEADGELERIVVVAALGLYDESSSLMLAKVGKWKNGQRPAPKCNLPGVRAKSGELPQVALERLLSEELMPFSGCFKVSHTEEAVEVKESERFGLRTRYLRVVHHALVQPEWVHPELAVAVHSTVPMVSEGSGGSNTRAFTSSHPVRSPSQLSAGSGGAVGGIASVVLRGRGRGTKERERRMRLCETQVLGIGVGKGTAELYAWISKDDFEFLSEPRGAKELDYWIGNLEWVSGPPDSAAWQQACEISVSGRKSESKRDDGVLHADVITDDILQRAI